MNNLKVFKKSDIFTIIMIVVAGTLAAYYITNMLLGNPDDARASFKVIEGVAADVAPPDSEVFNEDAINPTVEVYVGSCEDVDQNGILSAAELSACGEAHVEEDKEEEEESKEEQEPEENKEKDPEEADDDSE